MAAAHNGNQPGVTHLEAGSFLSNQDLKADGWAGSSIKASLNEPVEVLIVEGPEFQRWLKETPSAQISLQQIAQEHRASWFPQSIMEAGR
jgi:hypothetical protein